MKLAQRVAVITGAAQGIGAACTRLFAEQGAKVVIADINETGGSALADEIVKGGGAAIFRRTDVAAQSDCTALIEHAIARFERIDILVNNAGIVHGAEFLELAEEDFDRVLRVNLKGAFLCGQSAARRMIAQSPQANGDRGVIINMSSINSVVAIANQVAYTVSKGGLNQLTKVMALALAPHRIRVMGIGPGSIATEMLKAAVLTDGPARDRIMSRTPLQRLGEPDEIAKVALFLASDDASYMTGTTVYPDGGRLALNYTV
jgi:NAD(P)-dependent dehydrogenase (short-subunit alcohol dehydrogenase family)